MKNLTFVALVTGLSVWTAPSAHAQLNTKYSRINECETPVNLSDIAGWAEKLDTAGNLAMPKPDDSGDYVTKMGAIIDESCFKNHAGPERQKMIDRMENILARVGMGVGQCSRLFGFNELSSVLHTLRRVRFSCKKLAAKTAAEAELTDHIWIGTLPCSSTFTKNYRVSISPESMLLGEEDPDHLAATLFHETLHHTAANNRQWHNESWMSGKHSTKGCKNSLFEDRVYFISAACFPRTSYGQDFFAGNGSASTCANVCNAALTEVDDDMASKYGGGFGAKQGLVARPYAKVDVEQTCRLVNTVEKRNSSLNTDSDNLQKRQMKVSKYFFTFGPDTMMYDKIRDYFSTVTDFAQTISMSDKAPVLEKLRTLRDELNDEYTRLCQQGQPRARNQKFCELYPKSVRLELDYAYRWVSDRDEQDAEIKRFFRRPD